MNGYGRLLTLAVPRRLALASIPADFADWLDYAAIVALLVFTWDEGPLALAFFALSLTAPYVVIGPFLAVLVDRTPLARVLVLANLGRALTTLALVFADQTVAVLIIVFLRGAIDSAFTPARQGAIQASTPPELLGSANGLHQAISQTSKIAGPALGGVLLAFLPAQTVFGINAGLSLLAAVTLWGIALPPRPIRENANIRTELTAGAAEFSRNRLLLTALIFSAVAYFGIFLYDALIALITSEFGLGATAFGFAIAASGGGGLVGALAAGRFATLHPMASMIASAVIAGIITVLVAVTSLAGAAMPAPIFFLAMALMGGSTAFMLVPYRTIVQQETPPDRIGRVFAAGEAVTMAMMLSAPFIGSFIASHYGTGAAFLSGGAVLLALALVTLLLQWRKPRPHLPKANARDTTRQIHRED